MRAASKWPDRWPLDFFASQTGPLGQARQIAGPLARRTFKRATSKHLASGGEKAQPRGRHTLPAVCRPPALGRQIAPKSLADANGRGCVGLRPIRLLYNQQSLKLVESFGGAFSDVRARGLTEQFAGDENAVCTGLARSIARSPPHPSNAFRACSTSPPTSSVERWQITIATKTHKLTQILAVQA